MMKRSIILVGLAIVAIGAGVYSMRGEGPEAASQPGQQRGFEEGWRGRKHAA